MVLEPEHMVDGNNNMYLPANTIAKNRGWDWCSTSIPRDNNEGPSALQTQGIAG